MNLQQLEYFITVAEEGTFTRAAKTLHVSQPGVSLQIKLLERELGQSLFHRTHRAVSLTEAGRIALPHARAVLAAAASVKNSIDDLLGLVSGQVRLGIVISCISVNLPKLLASFHASYPEVEMSLSEGTTTHLLDALAGRRIDLALIGNVGTPQEIERFEINADPLVAVTQKDAQFRGRSTIPLAELALHRLISPPEGTAMREQFSAACSSVGVTPHIAFEVADLRLAALLAAEGLGIATLPNSVAQSQSSHVDILPIVAPTININLSLAWCSKSPLSPAARAMVDFTRRSVGRSLRA